MNAREMFKQLQLRLIFLLASDQYKESVFPANPLIIETDDFVFEVKLIRRKRKLELLEGKLK